MEIFISALVGELVSRSMSSIINNYSRPPAKAVEVSLERILLRGQIIIDEAAARHITNQGLLRQLSMLRDAVYRGFHVLDTIRCQAYQEEDEAKHNHAHSHSWAVSKFRYAQLLFLSSSNSRKTLQGVEKVLVDLRTMIHDASEMIMFLTTYPPLYRQPYSMHLLLDKCIFGRQMEVQMVINFLLCTRYCSRSLDRFDVLPVVGPRGVGKSTLVAHVCEDKRVRDHFSQIVFFRHGSFRGEDMATLRDRCAGRHENKGRLLVVVDIDGDLDDDQWERLCSLCQQCTTSGSKIIITSQSENIMKLGTTQTLTLKHLSQEAFWYFFKVTTFGSTDLEMHPRLVYLAMEIVSLLNGNLVAANIVAGLLRANFNVAFWCNLLAFRRRYVQNHLSKFGEHPHGLLKVDRPTYLQRICRTTEGIFVLDQTCSSQEEAPKITVLDVLSGSIRPQGAFKVLTLKSRIPPYHCYISTCEIRELRARAGKRKRSLINGV